MILPGDMRDRVARLVQGVFETLREEYPREKYPDVKDATIFAIIQTYAEKYKWWALPTDEDG
ncbi:MAG: hypothetical protein WC891_08865 [Actinomycetota bacterium]|jgi:hypothetical protein